MLVRTHFFYCHFLLIVTCNYVVKIYKKIGERGSIMVGSVWAIKSRVNCFIICFFILKHQKSRMFICSIKRNRFQGKRHTKNNERSYGNEDCLMYILIKWENGKSIFAISIFFPHRLCCVFRTKDCTGLFSLLKIVNFPVLCHNGTKSTNEINLNILWPRHYLAFTTSCNI